MRQKFIKIISISLIALFSLTSFFISNGFARHHRHDHSEFHSSKKARKSKESQKKRVLHRARLKNKQRRLSNRKQEMVNPGPLLSKSINITPPSQRGISRVALPASLLFFESQGNIEKIRRDFISVSKITPLERRRLNFITRVVMPPRTRFILYGFSGLRTANFNTFVRLMLNQKLYPSKNNIFMLGYLS